VLLTEQKKVGLKSKLNKSQDIPGWHVFDQRKRKIKNPVKKVNLSKCKLFTKNTRFNNNNNNKTTNDLS